MWSLLRSHGYGERTREYMGRVPGERMRASFDFGLGKDQKLFYLGKVTNQPPKFSQVLDGLLSLV